MTPPESVPMCGATSPAHQYVHTLVCQLSRKSDATANTAPSTNLKAKSVSEHDENDYYRDDVSTLGDRITAAREALSITDEDLAHQLGVKLKTIQSWENDRREPRANKVQMLSGLLSVSLVWLLTGEGVGVAEPTSDGDANESLGAILQEIRAIRSEIIGSANKLFSLEKRLAAAIKAAQS